MAILTRTEDFKKVLLEAKTVAVLGAHISETKAAHYVPRYLNAQGYTVYPINPAYAGKNLFGQQVIASLTDLKTSVDIINVFRRSEHLPEHLEEILAMHPLPTTVWFQLGIKNDDVARKLSTAGINVVQNRCTLADHQRLLG